MSRINVEMVRMRLQKSVFLLNHQFQQPPQGEVITLGLNLRNWGEFYQNYTMVNFIQFFKTQGESNVPFSLELEMAAVFSLSAPVPLAEQNSFVHKTLAQMVFPHTREYVAEITRRGGFPPLLLNLGGFQEGEGVESSPAMTSVSGSKWIH
ncbi:MAG: protein-export chaperone SecB [Deltaproteobacteria bacterium]|jgi:preprotein translocase subunit SecB|nr:protein-export chaperone SecB [Deltaproteobacteria bacterium]